MLLSSAWLMSFCSPNVRPVTLISNSERLTLETASVLVWFFKIYTNMVLFYIYSVFCQLISLFCISAVSLLTSFHFAWKLDRKYPHKEQYTINICLPSKGKSLTHYLWEIWESMIAIASAALMYQSPFLLRKQTDLLCIIRLMKIGFRIRGNLDVLFWVI